MDDRRRLAVQEIHPSRDARRDGEALPPRERLVGAGPPLLRVCWGLLPQAAGGEPRRGPKHVEKRAAGAERHEHHDFVGRPHHAVDGDDVLWGFGNRERGSVGRVVAVV